MPAITFTKTEVLKDTPYNTWYDLYGNLQDSRLLSNNLTLYHITDLSRKEFVAQLPLMREEILQLAKLEMEIVLKESGVKSFEELWENVKASGGERSINYKLEYSCLIPETKEVIFKKLTIPVKTISDIIQLAKNGRTY
jgi:hypothetical protein